MSDVEDDCVSLRVSLMSRDPSVISALSSRRSSFIDFPFDPEDRNDHLGGRRDPPHSAKKSTSAQIVSTRKTRLSLRRASSPNANMFVSSTKSWQGRLRRILARKAETNTSTSSYGFHEHLLEPEGPPTGADNRISYPSILLYGVSGSGKTSIMRSFQLLQQDHQRIHPSLGLLLIEACVERMLDVVGTMEEAKITFSLPDSPKHLNELGWSLWHESTLEKSTILSSIDQNPEMIDSPRLVKSCKAISYLWHDEGVRQAYELLKKSYISKDTV